MNPRDKQIGGSHYKKLKIQPIEYALANDLGGPELSIIKYATRWRDKGGIEDIKKLIHVAELMVEYYERESREAGSAAQEPYREGPTLPQVCAPSYPPQVAGGRARETFQTVPRIGNGFTGI